MCSGWPKNGEISKDRDNLNVADRNGDGGYFRVAMSPHPKGEQ